MPYYGGVTLAQLLEWLRPWPVAERTSQQLLELLDRARAAAAVSSPAQGPGLQLLARFTYVQALCWIAACLADALQYAHERGLVHLDLKPSNVLLAADGQPMLLDFNLSQGPLLAEAKAPERFGGTVDFMSPEQKQALAAFRDGRSAPALVDGRSDVFSLGLI